MTLAIVAASAVIVGTPSSAETTVLRFSAVADAHVDSSLPSQSFGLDTAMWVDGSPRKEIFLRFDVAGVGDGVVTSAVLRLFQKDSAPTGGDVLGVSSTSWTESITWETRPTIDGALAASFPAVAAGSWYELDVTSLVTADGLVSVGIRSTDADGARWQSRQSTTPPELVLQVAPEVTTTTGSSTTTENTTTATDASTTTSTPEPTTTSTNTTTTSTTTTTTTAPPEADLVTTVATASEGSTTPSISAAQHRIARTDGGRLLALFGSHGSGIQLAWRDPGGSWHRTTRGATTSGALLTGTGTGDWPVSIVTAVDASGEEHAWVIWAGRRSSNQAPLVATRLSDLDDADGPSVGPVTVLDEAPGFRADVVADGDRLAVIWSRSTSSGTYEVLVGWITDLGTERPTLTNMARLLENPSNNRYGTLVSTTSGVRAVLRATGGKLQVFRHDAGTSLTTWTAGRASATLVDQPAAAVLSDGSILTAAENNMADGVVTVQRFDNSGEPHTVELEVTGYHHPALAAHGAGAWLVMVRASDGAIVSRALASPGWTANRLEVDAGSHTWPNPVRDAAGRLTVLVGAAGETSVQSAVLVIDRAV